MSVTFIIIHVRILRTGSYAYAPNSEIGKVLVQMTKIGESIRLSSLSFWGKLFRFKL